MTVVIDATLKPFETMAPGHAVEWLFLLNVAVFLISILAGEILVRIYHDRPASAPPDPVQWQEWALAVSCVVLNTGVSFAGWYLWRHRWIVVLPSWPWRSLLDVFVLLAAMDFLMYVFHRIAHLRWLFPLIHATHHRYDRPRPLNLFVLNPVEVLGFGGLWLGLLCFYHATWAGMLFYLFLNTCFGTLGHLGVEPFPKSFANWPILRHLGSSTFHANHHGDRDVNFGFYTDIWDRVFRTRRV